MFLSAVTSISSRQKVQLHKNSGIRNETVQQEIIPIVLKISTRVRTQIRAFAGRNGGKAAAQNLRSQLVAF